MKKIFKEVYLLLYYTLVAMVNFLPDSQFGNKIRGSVYKLFIRKAGQNLQISKSVNILNPRNIEIGDNVYIGFGSWINAMGNIKIDDEVIVGPYVCISSGNHTKINGSFRFGEHSKSPVKIGKGCWLAAHVVLLAGSNIPEGSCVAAGGVGRIEEEESSIFGGVPAKKILK
ncbi:acyltransferase [Bacillus sp. N1-1]|uniref:acyltransferase n=1 Tax=Bacillus sp. N1-1 TaxID=2682541 RepID=UPI001317E01C|nr:acyltransferase [Bacillus sp. N1-1]QHA93679.1 hypothetical protein GNK04_20840 [Bacillus sp. N1-1]